jgi:homocysteine S-methyltransferase
MVSFEQFVENGAFGLSEGSIYERLRRNPSVQFDPHIFHASLVYDERYAPVLEALHREYLEVGQAYSLPMLALTDTWRANMERIRLSAFPERPVNQDNARFLIEIRDGYGTDASPIFVGGHLGCRGGAYSPDQRLSEEEAAEFHAPQVAALAEAGVDFLYGGTLPALSEARGLARAMAQTELPYLLSFVIQKGGKLLDTTPLATAIETIDHANHRPPTGYAINCVHPSIFMEGMRTLQQRIPALSHRILSFQANTSARAPMELVGLVELETEDPKLLARQMMEGHWQFGTRFMGGCCGTDTSHIVELAVAHRSSR